MFVEVLLLIVGMLLLVKGADWFVDGASDIARALRIPSLIIGLTLVSMGTSAPEASVSITSAVKGMNDMSLGNVVGSNIFNTLLILGVSALIVPLAIGKDLKKFDIPVMILMYVILSLFAFVITPYTINLVESIILIVLFVAYTAFLIVRAMKEKRATEAAVTVCGGAGAEGAGTEGGEANEQAKSEKPKPEWKKILISLIGFSGGKTYKPIWLSVILAAAGLCGIIFGGDIVVDNAAAIAQELGMSEALVGLTIVAVGTSLPELVTSVMASIKKENDIAVGNVIGSNIFNVVFILGLSSVITPLTTPKTVLLDLMVMLGSGVVILAFALCGKKLKRWQGAILVVLYIAYLTYIIIRN